MMNPWYCSMLLLCFVLLLKKLLTLVLRKHLVDAEVHIGDSPIHLSPIIDSLLFCFTPKYCIIIHNSYNN